MMRNRPADLTAISWARSPRREWLRQVARLAWAAPVALLARQAASADAQDDAIGWSFVRPATVVLFRHAQAPGVGDPPGFVLGDCATQRNLDEVGRQQARRIGEAFRRRGIRVDAVISSQWCRARETAQLAFPGTVQDDAAFNSFFDDRRPETAQSAAALQRLVGWRGPGVLVVVTHQVNISALTGVSPASGEGIVLRAAGDRLDVLGRLPAPR